VSGSVTQSTPGAAVTPSGGHAVGLRRTVERTWAQPLRRVIVMAPMSATGALVQLSPRDYDAVLFDLDGVLTPTASLHAAAWKLLFDDFLRARSQRTGEPFVPFDIGSDYPRYVDGKPRQDGVVSFLAARGIALPLAEPDGAPGEETVQGLGHLKDTYFLQKLRERGVQPFEGATELLHTLRAQEVRTAVVTSSKNCAAVIEAAGIGALFDARVDGNDVEHLNLNGKPAPDAFLEAAHRLGVAPSRAVVVEDAIVGVQAGHAGGFGYVIGAAAGYRGPMFPWQSGSDGQGERRAVQCGTQPLRDPWSDGAGRVS
jgi:beta-phosphoglucomutase family hydrolase